MEAQERIEHNFYIKVTSKMVLFNNLLSYVPLNNETARNAHTTKMYANGCRAIDVFVPCCFRDRIPLNIKHKLKEWSKWTFST